VDIRRLDYFLKIAELRSMTAAAAALHVTQPTLTKSIKLLEEELGVSLLRRLPRGVELTIYGQSLVRHAQAVRVQLDSAIGELDGLRTGAEGQVMIGAGPSWLRRHLPLALVRALAERPRLKVRVFGGFDEALLRSLRHGDLDFVVAELPPDGAPDLEIEPLTSDMLGLCCRANHPLTRKKRKPTLESLLTYPWALPANNAGARRKLDSLFISRGLKPPVPTVETESMAFLFAFVRSSDALTFTTSTTTHQPEGAGLKMLDIPALRTSRGAGIISRRGAWLSPAAQSVITELKAICAADPKN
jgi:LysR family transcriptional regulator of gallate degradation